MSPDSVTRCGCGLPEGSITAVTSTAASRKSVANGETNRIDAPSPTSTGWVPNASARAAWVRAAAGLSVRRKPGLRSSAWQAFGYSGAQPWETRRHRRKRWFGHSPSSLTRRPVPTSDDHSIRDLPAGPEGISGRRGTSPGLGRMHPESPCPRPFRHVDNPPLPC